MKSTYHYVIRNGKLVPASEQPQHTKTITQISIHDLINKYEKRIEELENIVATQN